MQVTYKADSQKKLRSVLRCLLALLALRAFEWKRGLTVDVIITGRTALFFWYNIVFIHGRFFSFQPINRTTVHRFDDPCQISS